MSLPATFLRLLPTVLFHRGIETVADAILPDHRGNLCDRGEDDDEIKRIKTPRLF